MNLLNVRSKSTHKVLNASLLWFFLGALIAVGFGFLWSTVPEIRINFLDVIFSRTGWWIFLIIIGFMGLFRFLISFLTQKDVSIALLGLLFAGYSLLTSFLLAFVFSAYVGDNTAILIILAVPFGIFAIASILGYFNLLSFINKIWKIIALFSFAMGIMWIVMWFVVDDILLIVFSSLGVIVTSAFIFFDLKYISEFDNHNNSNFEYNAARMGLIFGLKLLTDMVWVIYHLSRLISRFRR